MNEHLTPAQRAAVEKRNKQVSNRELPEVTNTSYYRGKKRKIITLPSGAVIRIRRLNPAEFMTIYGSPISGLLTQYGLENFDSLSQQNRSPDEIESILDDIHNKKRHVVAKGIISIPVTTNPKGTSSILSVDELLPKDFDYIYNQIDEISGFTVDIPLFKELWESLHDHNTYLSFIRHCMVAESLNISAGEYLYPDASPFMQMAVTDFGISKVHEYREQNDKSKGRK